MRDFVEKIVKAKLGMNLPLVMHRAALLREEGDDLEEENDKMVYVISSGSTSFQCFHGPYSSRVNKRDSNVGAIFGHLDPSLVVSPHVLVPSSCSTDETVMAELDGETESGDESGHDTIIVCLVESADHDNEEKTAMYSSCQPVVYTIWSAIFRLST